MAQQNSVAGGACGSPFRRWHSFLVHHPEEDAAREQQATPVPRCVAGADLHRRLVCIVLLILSFSCCSRHGCSTHACDEDGRVFLPVKSGFRDSGIHNQTELGLHIWGQEHVGVVSGLRSANAFTSITVAFGSSSPYVVWC